MKWSPEKRLFTTQGFYDLFIFGKATLVQKKMALYSYEYIAIKV